MAFLKIPSNVLHPELLYKADAGLSKIYRRKDVKFERSNLADANLLVLFLRKSDSYRNSKPKESVPSLCQSSAFEFRVSDGI